MFDPEDENSFKEIYRQSLAKELSRPEIAIEKKKFLSTFEASAPAPVFSFASAGFFVPVLVLAAAFGIFYQVGIKSSPVVGPSSPIYGMFGSIMEDARTREVNLKAAVKAEKEARAKQQSAGRNEIRLEDPVKNHMKPRVIVKRIASSVGPTMVYQKAYRDVPVTIVWVFPRHTSGGGYAK